MFKDATKKKTGRILKSFIRLRGYEVLSDLDLEIKGKTAHIEHILIGTFGMMFFSCLDLKKGELYGNDRDEKWAIVTKTDKTRIDNPHLKNEHNNAVVRDILAKEEVYRVGFENVIVIGCPKPDTQLAMPVDSLGIYSPKALKKYLKRVKFEKDNGVDVKKTAAAVKKYIK